MMIGTGFGLQLCTWDGRPTRHVPLRPLTDDEHGSWYRWPAGAPETGPDGATVRHADDFLVLVPRHGAWVARFGDDGLSDRHATVTTATATTGHGITAVELDLDVVRFTDGRVAVIDQDHFDRCRLAFGYPTELVEQAVWTTRSLYRALACEEGPFGPAGSDHLAALRGSATVTSRPRPGDRGGRPAASASGSTTSATASTTATATPAPPIVSVG